MSEPQERQRPDLQGSSLADWRRQESLFQPHRSAFWLFLVLLLVALAYALFEQGTFAAAYPLAWVLSLLLVGVVVLPVLILVYRMDQFEPEPPSMATAAFLWGAFVAILFASIANGLLIDFLQKIMDPATLQDWGPAIVGPTNEEFYKGMGLLVLFLIAPREFNSLMDGLVYGAFIGLGFQAVENVQYFVRAVDAAGGQDQIGPVLATFFIRVIASGLYSHVLFTSLVGIGFAYAVTRVWRPLALRIAALAGLFALAWLAHFIWNSPLLDSILVNQGVGAFVVYALIKGLPFLAFLVVLVMVARRQEADAFTLLVATEVGTDVLNEQELSILRSARKRRAARRAVTQARGAAAGRLLGQLQREQIKLGVLSGKTVFGDPVLERQRDKIRMLRSQIASLPARF